MEKVDLERHSTPYILFEPATTPYAHGNLVFVLPRKPQNTDLNDIHALSSFKVEFFLD